jgi:hypothetical protein
MQIVRKFFSYKSFKFLSLFGVLPALLLGVFTMIYFNVPKSIWLLNLFFVFTCITIGLISNRFFHLFSSINPKFIVLISFLLTLLPFLQEGIMNVHRWINIATFSVNIGLIISPIILIQISKIQNIFFSSFCFVLFTVIFILQPDASQVISFSVSASLLLINKIRSKTLKISLVSFVILAITISLLTLDNLKPVSYVENIIQMTGEIHSFFKLLAILSLLLLLLPFFIINENEKKHISFSLGVYFSTLLLTTFVGNFPVMIMGYGISPILGYFAAIIFLINHDELIGSKQK